MLPIHRILLFGDSYGIPELLAKIPSEKIVGVVAAENRPQYHDELIKLSNTHNAPFFIQPSPKSSKYDDFKRLIIQQSPDSLICHSYSMLIQKDILHIVGGNAFNVHMALLPRNRGPNPIQWALINGDNKTGVTLHVMDEGFDSGAIIDQEEVDISDSDTWVTLTLKMKIAANVLLNKNIFSLLKGTWHASPQNENNVIHNNRISKNSIEIKFDQMSDIQIYNLIRAQVAPLKGAYINTSMGRLHINKLISLSEIAELRINHT